MKGVNIFLADGFEDMEALAVNDVLTRGGVNVNLVSISDQPTVLSSHGVTVSVDLCLEDLRLDHSGTKAKDIMIFPGGMPGTKNLADNGPLMQAMKDHYAAGGSVAAICAAPGLVLSQLGDAMDEVEFTCYDGFEKDAMACGGIFTPVPTVTSGRIITGRSAGYAIDFGLAILSYLTDSGNAANVEYSLILQNI